MIQQCGATRDVQDTFEMSKIARDKDTETVLKLVLRKTNCLVFPGHQRVVHPRGIAHVAIFHSAVSGTFQSIAMPIAWIVGYF